jgi:endonuclease YncB( thermonuclease family)
MLRLVISVALSVGILTGQAHADVSGRARIIDGDTLEIAAQRIRLHGIDAPEMRQSCRKGSDSWPCGAEATKALRSMIQDAEVTCQERDRDRYGRIVAVCFARGEDLNAAMVRRGWALAYRRYSVDYVDVETSARAARAGLWAGEFVPPWDWRRGKRLATTMAPAPDDCRIKGNISRSGERIYHMPGGTYYSRTRIDTTKGERWFCSEEEARAAGWTRAKR